MKFLITYSKLRGRVLDYPFSITLSEFINDIFEKNSESEAISSIEIEFILKNIIKNLDLNFYDFLEDTSELASFFIKLKTNEYDVNKLPFEAIKKQEIILIFNEYNKFLQTNNLADLGDIEKFVRDYTKENEIEVLADNFEIGKVDFFRSKLEKEIFNNLKKEYLKESLSNKKAQIKQIECFDKFDEVKKALHLARKFIENNEEIKIIVSNLDEYFEIFEALSENYGIGVYSTKGVSLHKLIYKYPHKIKELKQKAKIIQNRLKELNIKITLKEIEEKLLEERILEKNLIELTEPNQIFSYKNIKNLIFVGVNLDNVPPQTTKGMFYIKDLYEDNSFYESELFFKRMQEISQNLFVIYQKDKKSIILEEYKEEPIIHQIHNIESSRPYENSYKSEIKKFSASQINTYQNCPRAYFYKYILNLRDKKEESLEMEAVDKGSIMHKAFELMTLHYYKCGVLKENEYYINKAFRKYEKDDVFTAIFKTHLYNMLTSFREYLKTFKNPKTELTFYLDKNLKITDRDNYFIKGIIDRIDIDEEINIVDYKSKKEDKIDTSKTEDVANLKDVQLGLYFYWAKKRYDKPTTASLVSFNNDSYEMKEFVKMQECDEPKISRKKLQNVCYNEEYENNLKNTIFEVKSKIENGEFDTNEEAKCEWCDFINICKGKK